MSDKAGAAPKVNDQRLYLVRHGHTVWNAEQRMQGHTDTPLSPEGVQQARALGAHFATRSIVAVYSSDLLRAAETARVIAGACGAPLTTAELLREQMFGEWEGLTYDEIVARGEAEAVARYRSDPVTYRPPASEPLHAVWARMTEARRRITEECPTGSIVIVGHGGSLRMLLCEAIQAPPRCAVGFRLANASVSRIDRSPTRSQIAYLNRTSHLDGLELGGSA